MTNITPHDYGTFPRVGDFPIEPAISPNRHFNYTITTTNNSNMKKYQTTPFEVGECPVCNKPLEGTIKYETTGIKLEDMVANGEEVDATVKVKVIGFNLSHNCGDTQPVYRTMNQ